MAQTSPPPPRQQGPGAADLVQIAAVALLLPGVLVGVAAAEALRARGLRWTWWIVPAIAGAGGAIRALPDSETLGSVIGGGRWAQVAATLAPLWCCAAPI